MRSILCVAVLAVVVAGQSDKDCSPARDTGNGNCDGAAPGRKFYFDKTRGVCQPFQYKGCAGNGNRFDSAKECKEFCVNGAGAKTLHDAQKPNPLKDACKATYATDHLTPKNCSSAADCGAANGFDCTGGYCCAKKDYVCNLDYDAGKFAVSGPGKSDRYFYSTQYKVCMRFSYYGSMGNENNFPDYNSCRKMCP
ncbi:unnamed protein product, partial [Mesorhabditis spiculigera]